MAYATQADIVGLYGERALLNVAPLHPNGEVDEAAVATALDRASAEIDAYLTARYDVPLAQASTFVKQIAVDIAVYRMPIGLDQQTSEHRLRYEDAIKYLRDVAAGKAGIGLPETDGTDENVPVGRQAVSSFLRRA